MVPSDFKAEILIFTKYIKQISIFLRSVSSKIIDFYEVYLGHWAFKALEKLKNKNKKIKNENLKLKI